MRACVRQDVRVSRMRVGCRSFRSMPACALGKATNQPTIGVHPAQIIQPTCVCKCISSITKGCALVIQCFYRTTRARHAYLERYMERAGKLHAACTVVQTALRGFLARKVLVARRHEAALQAARDKETMRVMEAKFREQSVRLFFFCGRVRCVPPLIFFVCACVLCTCVAWVGVACFRVLSFVPSASGTALHDGLHCLLGCLVAGWLAACLPANWQPLNSFPLV